MLTEKEKGRVIRNIWLCSILSPVTVDVKRRELKWNLPPWKLVLLKLSFWGLVFNAAHKAIGLAYIFLWAIHETSVLEIILHIVLAEAAPLVAFWYYVLFTHSPRVHAAVVKLTFAPSKNEDASSGRCMLSRWRRYTLQDLIALFAPPMVFVAAILVTACFLHAPEMKLLLYAAVPAQLDTPVVFVLCMAEDIRCVLLIATTAMGVFPVQVLAFDRINLSLSQLAVESRSGRFLKSTGSKADPCTSSFQVLYRMLFPRSDPYRQDQSKQDIRTLRELQLYVAFVNEVHSYIIFTFKMYCISLCIVNGYAAVAHFSENHLFGVMYYILFFDCLCLYALIYDKAFQIPRHFDKALKGIMLRLFLNFGKGRRREFHEKQLRSIPRAEVKVGSFHTLERTSTLVFIHHVFTNIVNMLVG